ncbi:hypothetical protein L7F22_066535 [Adiantum nelumboides]|nr:hypothetical protein [Adiantum nelumboides]
MRTMDIVNIPPLHPCARQLEPSRAGLNNKRTRSWVERNDTDGQADEGHEQARVDPEAKIEETETLMEEPIMKENEQGMVDVEPMPVSEDPMSIREDLVPIREDPVLVKEDPMPIREGARGNHG